MRPERAPSALAMALSRYLDGLEDLDREREEIDREEEGVDIVLLLLLLLLLLDILVL